MKEMVDPKPEEIGLLCDSGVRAFGDRLKLGLGDATGHKLRCAGGCEEIVFACKDQGWDADLGEEVGS